MQKRSGTEIPAWVNSGQCRIPRCESYPIQLDESTRAHRGTAGSPQRFPKPPHASGWKLRCSLAQLTVAVKAHAAISAEAKIPQRMTMARFTEISPLSYIVSAALVDIEPHLRTPRRQPDRLAFRLNSQRLVRRFDGKGGSIA